MEKVRPYPVTRHGEKKIFIFEQLESSQYVFLRHGAIGGPLQLQYDGPLKCSKRERKIKNRKLKINNRTKKINNHDVTVSVDRLKPAYIVPNDLEEKTAETRNVLIPMGQTNTCDGSGANNNDRTTEENARNKYVTRSRRKVRFSDWFRVKVVNYRTPDVLYVSNF